MYVCDAAGFATSTGCTGGTELCNGTSTSPNVSCNFTDTIPTVDQSYTYYAYIMDWHYATSSGNPATSTYTVTNVAPYISYLILQSGNDINLNLKNASEVVASTTSTSVTDNNGCTDIVSATSTIYWSSATSSENCVADDNYCYHIASASCEQLAGSCTGSSDLNATYTCTTTMAFHAIPTDDSNGNPASTTNWLAGMTAFDEALSGTLAATTGVEVITTTGLDVTESEVPYGAIQGGQDSGSDNATTTIINYGNSPIDGTFLGEDLLRILGGDYIGANEQEYSTSTFTYGAGTWTLSSTTPFTRDIDAPKPMDQTDVSDQVFWGINIPLGKISGAYSGTTTISAALDEDGW